MEVLVPPGKCWRCVRQKAGERWIHDGPKFKGGTGIIVPDVVQRKPAYMLNGISASPTGRPCPRRLTTDRRRERRTYDVKTGKQSN